MKKIESLTDTQRAKFPEYVQKWTRIGLSTTPANREKAEAGILQVYKVAGLESPRIVWCDSPMSMGLTRAILLDKGFQEKIGDSVWDSVWDSVRDSVGASVWDSVWDSVRDSVWDSVRDSVGASVWDSVRDSVWDSVRASVWDSVWDSVRDSVWDSVRASVGDSVWDSVWDSVRASVGDSVWDSVGASVRDSVGDSVWDSVWDSVGASGYGQHDASWIGFYEFFRKEMALITQTEKLLGLQEVTENAGWFLPHKGICWISERHCIVLQDEQKRLHCETGPAIRYPDGWSIYAWHGTRIPAEWIEDKKSLTPQIALNWQNVEQRRAACEILGWANVLEHPSLNPRIVNEDEPHIGTLIEVDLPDAPKQWFIKYRCGTGRWFAESVNNKKFNTALKANAGGNGYRGEGDPMSFVPFLRT